MRHIVHISIQGQNSHIKSISLRSELEQGMNFDGPHTEGIRWQRFCSRVDDVVAESHADVAWLSPGDAVTSCYNMASGN